MNIRIMQIEDYDEVYALWRGTLSSLNDVDDSREGIDKYLKRNPDTCFVAENNCKIIGAVLGGHDGRRGFIWHASVAKDKQRQGIGEKLVNAVNDAFLKEGIQKVALVVFNENEKGNSFWQKQGFEERKDLVYRNKVLIDKR